MTAKQTNPRFPLRREIGRMVALSLAIAGAIAALLALGGFNAQLPPMAAAGGVCLIGGAVAMLAMAWRAAAAGREGLVQGAMIGIMVRLAICLAGAAALVAATGWNRRTVAGWVLGWYLLMLLLDAAAMLRYARQGDDAAASEQPAEAPATPTTEVRA